ncbi:hypothetical protein SAZ10_10325 [Mesorhizobium sp. BAC0120]|uniref:hypothetical protein n=1 Tax=Mesorhizobium sp. BAC0120 TaxID=3090670 RepID=UPI00298CCBBE|nr:hypothetical protein [Mesorhizobium sp. BAC0120]MDW6022158.1 hypothetical protein [Mesorhizobium sp. BAC0120]
MHHLSKILFAGIIAVPMFAVIHGAGAHATPEETSGDVQLTSDETTAVNAAKAFSACVARMNHDPAVQAQSKRTIAQRRLLRRPMSPRKPLSMMPITVTRRHMLASPKETATMSGLKS